MLIIIEGVDRTGKTTLAESLKNRLNGADLYHCSAPDKHTTAIDEYVDPLCGYQPGSGRHVIYDRHWLGETVWPGIFGRPSIMTEADQLAIEAFLLTRGALLVLALREEESLKEAVESSDQPITGDQAIAAQRRFIYAAQQSPVPRFQYIHNEVPADEVIRTAAYVEKWSGELLEVRRVS